MPIRAFLSALTLFSGVAIQAQEKSPDKLPPLNNKVLQFATLKLGQQVGNGQCWTLADAALRSAGARRPGRQGYRAYQFGKQLEKKDKLLPGDVLQMYQVVFRYPRSFQQFPLHTAIVSKVDGTKVEVLNQNLGGDKKVQRTEFDLRGLKRGKIFAFRPQPRSR
ncbi:MAG: CHAP domain-containing protein [Gemmataceae bacterium]